MSDKVGADFKLLNALHQYATQVDRDALFSRRERASMAAIEALCKSLEESAPPKPQVVVTEKMLDAANASWNETEEIAPDDPLAARSVDFDNNIRKAYRAMAALAPMPDVTTAAVMKAHKTFYAFDAGCSEKAIEAALKSALPILLGRKNGEGVEAAYAAEGKPKNHGTGEYKADPMRQARSWTVDSWTMAERRTGPKDRRGPYDWDQKVGYRRGWVENNCSTHGRRHYDQLRT